MAAGAGNPGEGGGGDGAGAAGTSRAPPPATSSGPRSGKEVHHAESDRAVSWYTRMLELLGMKSHGDPGQTFTPWRYSSVPWSQQSSDLLRLGLNYDALLGVVLVSFKEYLSRSQCERINSCLEFFRRERESALGSSAEEGEDEYECEDTLSKKARIEKHTEEIKAVIQDALIKNQISPDYARYLVFHTDLLGMYARRLSRKAACNYALDALKEKIKLPDLSSLLDKIISVGSAIRSGATLAGAAYRVAQSDGPGVFHDVGKQALELIWDPYYLYKKYEQNSDPKLSLICGSEVTASQNLVRKVMLNLKSEGYFLCLKASDIDHGLHIQVNAQEGDAAVNEFPDLRDPNSASLLVEKLNGNDMNAMLYLPFSLRKSKVELQLLHPFHGSTCSIGLNNEKMPCVSISSLCGLQDLHLRGVHSLAFGGELKINESNSWFSFSAGQSVRTEMFNAGLTFKQPGLFNYTLSSKINTSTVLGGLASYSYVSNEWNLSGGFSYSFDPTLHVKGRIGNDQVVNALISKELDGKGSVHFASEVDFKEIWRSPRVGLFFSYP